MNRPLPKSQVSQRLDHETADVWGIHREALARQAGGEDILLLSVGDPDFPTPHDIAAYLMRQVEKGRTHYSPSGGEPVLLDALAKLESRVENRPFTPARFTVFQGATSAIYSTLACILDPGDEIIVPEPMYIGYHSIFTALGVRLVSVPLAAETFELSVEAIVSRITERTRAVMVNTPGNPCGNIIDGERLRELARRCLERGVWMISDEVYSVFTYEERHISALKVAESLENVVVVDSLSKSHAMSGWRIGWTVASEAFTRTLHRYCSAAFFGCSQFIQDAAAYALSINAPHIEEMRQQFQARRDYAVSRIARLNHLACFPPKAGMFVMLDVRQTGMHGDQFAQALLDEAGISAIPGSGFGNSTRDYVRLSLTVPMPVLEEAFDRIEAMG